MNDFVSYITPLDALPAKPKRVILHWTAGPAKANSVDKAHYHFIFNQPDGEIVKGTHSVADNMRVITGGSYAAHTKGFNSFSVGMSFAGMMNSAPGRKFGPCPLLEAQIRNGLKFVAACMKEWQLNPSNPGHLFTHYEAEALHGVPQNNKWDITEIQFAPWLSKNQVGPWLRAVTKNHFNIL